MAFEGAIWRRRHDREYRWRCGLRTGNWHESHKAAGNAAVREGLAIWDGETLFTGPLVEIEARHSPRTKKAGQA